MQLPVLPCLNREPSFSQELDEVTETVVSFLKEDDSGGQSPKLGTCVRRVTTEAIMLKLKEKPSKMEKQERVRGPQGSSQEGKPQDSYLGVGTVSSESEVSKAYTGVPPTQVFFLPAETSPRTPPLKILEKCHSLPVSQSISMELDQVGWRRPRKFCTAVELKTSKRVTWQGGGQTENQKLPLPSFLLARIQG
ncbi:Protocadherin Fat 3 [Manis pentadactyla]|nr:Protocadherin Fat 3 [Manis pentadactyla]